MAHTLVTGAFRALFFSRRKSRGNRAVDRRANSFTNSYVPDQDRRRTSNIVRETVIKVKGRVQVSIPSLEPTKTTATGTSYHCGAMEGTVLPPSSSMLRMSFRHHASSHHNSHKSF